MIINKELIKLKQDKENAIDVITDLAGVAYEQGLVDETYLPAILKRESEYPTGLPFALPIAIPHIDTGCKTSFVSVMTLNEPVDFMSMDLSGDVLPTKIVFVFGILDPSQQLEILKQFAVSFANQERIEKLLEIEDKDDFLTELNDLLGGLLDHQEEEKGENDV